MIRKLEWSSGKILAYEASGRMSKEETIQIFSELSEAIKQYGKIRIFVLMPKLAWAEPSAWGIRLSFGLKHFFDIQRYALVTDNPLISWVFMLLSMIPGFKYRQYSYNDQLLAKAWVMAKHI